MKKHDYIESTALQLDLWGNRLAALERDADGAPERTRGELARRLRVLDVERRAIERKLVRAGRRSAEIDWNPVRDGIERDVAQYRELASDVCEQFAEV